VEDRADESKIDIRDELPGPARALAAADGAVYWQTREGVQVFSSWTKGARPLVGASELACPWPAHVTSSDDGVKIRFSAGVAYVHRPSCGVFGIALKEPRKITPILRFLGEGEAKWGDGTDARVSPASDVVTVPDGDALLVCVGAGERGDEVELWSTSRQGAPRERVAKVDGADCREVTRDDTGAFFSLRSGGVFRWNRGTRAVTHVATPTAALATALQTTATHLFYLDGEEIMRVGKDGSGLTKIDREPGEGVRFVVDDRDLTIATKAKIVRLPLAGGAAETLFVASAGSHVATEYGVAKLGSDLWFSLSREDQKLYLARFSD
jgi:hypothetical protein